MGKSFHRIYLWIQPRKTVFLVGLSLLFGLLIWFAFNLKFNEDISKMIPSNSENEALQKVLKTAKFSDKIIINVIREYEGSVEDLTIYADALLDSLNENSGAYINYIQGKIEEETIFETLDFIYENIPIFITPSNYETISQKLNKDSIGLLTEGHYKTLMSPTGIMAKSTIFRDPFGMSIIASKRLQQLGISDGFILKDGFLVTKDEKNLLLFVSPKFPASNTVENAEFARQLYSFQASLNRKFDEKIHSEYFGGPLIAVANAQQIKSDIQITLTMAIVVLVILFVVFYKKLTIPILLIIPTVFGGLLALACLSIIRTEISAISLGIGAVLLGVSLDYSLHILTHIRNKDSVEQLFDSVTIPILMSSITTALAFLCLLFVESQALQDLGLFASISVLGASVFALIFIPQLYQSSEMAVSSPTVLDKLASYNFHQNKILIGLIAILLIVSVFTYKNVQFNQDISKLNYKPESIQLAEQHLDSLMHLSSKSLYVIAFGTDEEETLQLNDSVYGILQALKENNAILDYNSITVLVASQAIQKEKIKIWKAFWTDEKIQQTKANLMESGSLYGFKPSAYNDFYALIGKGFHPLSLSEFEKTEIMHFNDFIGKDSEFMTISSLVRANNEQIKIVKQAFKDKSNIAVIDRQAVNEGLLSHLKEDFNRLILYCLIAVVILLLLFFKNLKHTLVTIVPILLTWLITIGMMGVFGLEFNIFNIIISSFIFGLGVDYSIFITNGMLKEMNSSKPFLATYKTSIMLSVLTTVLGVGVLVFAKHPALYSLSIITIVGILSAMLISFTIQPILFKLLITNPSKQRGDGNH